jgi:hypothetical protein
LLEAALFAFEPSAVFSSLHMHARNGAAFSALSILARLDLLNRQLALHRFFEQALGFGAQFFLGLLWRNRTSRHQRLRCGSQLLHYFSGEPNPAELHRLTSRQATAIISSETDIYTPVAAAINMPIIVET